MRDLPYQTSGDLLPAVTSMWDWKLPGLREAGSLPPLLFQPVWHLLCTTALSCSLPFLLYLTADAPPSNAHTHTHSPTSQTTQQHNTQHTQSTHPADSRGKSLFVRLRFAFVHHCVRQRLCFKVCGTSAQIMTFKYFRLFQQLLSRKSDPWNSFKTL